NNYCDLVSKKFDELDSKTSTDLCLAERPLDDVVPPLVGKFHFKFNVNEDDNWEAYHDEFLYNLCYTYQHVIEENFNMLTDHCTEFLAIVMESTNHWYEESNGEKIMNMEVKIQFPYAHIKPGDQQRLVRNRVIQYLRTNNILSKLERQPIGDWEQIISN